MPITAVQAPPVLDEFIEFVMRDEVTADFVQTSRVAVFYDPRDEWFYECLDGITVPLDDRAAVDILAYGGVQFDANRVLSVHSAVGVRHTVRSIHNWRRSLHLEVVKDGTRTLSREARLVAPGPIMIT